MKEIIKKVDENSDGMFNYEEFESVYTAKKHVSKIEEIKEAIRIFDSNRDILIESSELKTAIQNLGRNLTDSQIKDIIKKSDYNGDGLLNEKEFIDLILNKTYIVEQIYETWKAPTRSDTNVSC